MYDEEYPMNSESLKSKIHSILRNGYFKDPDDMVDVSDGPDDALHVVIVSRKFDGRRTREKHDLIWSELTNHLSKDEWGKITRSIGMSPEEIKSHC